MAVEVLAGQLVEVTPRFLIEGQECECVWFFECVETDPTMLANLLLVIATCMITHLLPVLGADFELQSVKGKVVGPELGPEEEWLPEPGSTVAGAAEGDQLPSYAASVVSLYTTRPGRSGRGRFYLGAIPESQTTKSFINIDGTYWSGIHDFMLCIAAAFPLNAPIAGVKYQWVVLSRKVAATNKPPFPLAAVARVTRWKMSRALGTIRRRKVGRGK